MHSPEINEKSFYYSHQPLKLNKEDVSQTLARFVVTSGWSWTAALSAVWKSEKSRFTHVTSSTDYVFLTLALTTELFAFET